METDVLTPPIIPRPGEPGPGDTNPDNPFGRAVISMDPTGYKYDDGLAVGNTVLYHPDCLIQTMIDRRELSPAALDMRPEEVLDQHAGASGILRQGGEVIVGPDDGWAFPASVWKADQGDACERCMSPLLPQDDLVPSSDQLAEIGRNSAPPTLTVRDLTPSAAPPADVAAAIGRHPSSLAKLNPSRGAGPW